MEPILILGSSGHAHAVIDVIEQEGKYKIVGIVNHDGSGKQVHGHKVLGADKDLTHLCKSLGVMKGAIAVGDNFQREQIATRISQQISQFKFVTAIHPFSHVSKSASIGPGSVIMPGATIGPESKIGSFCIVNYNASLNHDCVMEDFSSLAPGVVTGGNVQIGRASAINIGSKIANGLTIGEHSVIGAGATVLEDIPSNVMAYGSPAKIKKSRRPGDKYM